jgi:aryl-alcohol dehydrogenase-like predicted oxidoreductase
MRLGKSSLEISRVVLGCMWPERLSEPDIERLIHAAFDAGITSFDSAPLYGFHASERILGRALRDRRDKVQILTKAGLRWDGTHGEVLFEFTDAGGTRRAVRKDSRPAQLVAEVEASLTRLGTDVIDLLQIHHPDNQTPLEESLSALADLVKAGKVRALGVSNFSPVQLAQASAFLAASAPLAALQCEYNLLERWPESELLPLCERHELTLLAYSPLAKGVLASDRSGRARRASDDSFYGHPLARPLIEAAVREALAPLAARHEVSAGEIALACLLAGSARSAVVVGASSEEQVRKNARAQHVTLSADELNSVRRRFATLETPLRALRRALAVPVLSRIDGLARRALDKLRR